MKEFMASKKASTGDLATTSFEGSLAELQQIVGQLEAGSLSLEESMSQFERGVGLLRSCHQVLEQAEQRIEILTGKDRDGQPVTTPFDASATLDATAPPQQQRSRRGASNAGQLFEE